MKTSIYKKSIQYLKKEIVFTTASIMAIITMFAIPINKAYWGYIDFKVLVILFCLMLVVAGFMKTGLFQYIADALLRKTNNIKVVTAILVGFSFFGSMLLTNDVALITFVPLTMAVLHKVSQKRLVYIIVLETIAANLGSMFTPIGNPQNLYLYSAFEMNIIDFLQIVAPISMVSGVLVCVFLCINKKGKLEIEVQEKAEKLDTKQVMFYFSLFLLSVLSVLHIVDYRICFLTVVIVAFIKDKTIFCEIDYTLLGTFVAFFIFVGNLGNIEWIRKLITELIAGRVFLMSVLLSQVISNVPAAIMLSGFTDHIRELLIGVNVGGLGTIVASLASLISYKLYMKKEDADSGLFFRVFTIMNVSTLLLLVLFFLYQDSTGFLKCYIM